MIESGNPSMTRRQPEDPHRLLWPVGRRVHRHRNDLVAAAAAHGVTNLRVFGSVARGEDRPGSDVDLLADFPPGLSLFGLSRLRADLEGILGTGPGSPAGPGLTTCPGHRNQLFEQF
jgi:predicted nucleotidyltransferase